jgi:hypothetical protein
MDPSGNNFMSTRLRSSGGVIPAGWSSRVRSRNGSRPRRRVNAIDVSLDVELDQITVEADVRGRNLSGFLNEGAVMMDSRKIWKSLLAVGTMVRKENCNGFPE